MSLSIYVLFLAIYVLIVISQTFWHAISFDVLARCVTQCGQLFGPRQADAGPVPHRRPPLHIGAVDEGVQEMPRHRLIESIVFIFLDTFVFLAIFLNSIVRFNQVGKCYI